MYSYQVIASIVLYKPNKATLRAINSFLSATSLNTFLYLIDNSPTNNFESSNKTLLANKKIKYIFNGKNVGYGAGHNIVLRQTINESEYHLVLNPDVEFDEYVLKEIYDYMQSHKDVGHLMPKVFYKNGDLQKLCNLLPQPLNLISRRFFEKTKWAKKLNDKYELQGFNYDKCSNIPNLSGCFMFLRCSILKQTGLFDERYFMYMEDVDLCRRIHAVSKTVFFPGASIIHGFEKESYTNKMVFKYHIWSAIKYFDKWGWVFDKQRDEFNNALLNSLSSDHS